MIKLIAVKASSKIILLLAGLSILLLHFGLVALNSISALPGKHKFKYLAAAYTSSFFHQSWDVFVPPPHSNYKLFASFESNGLHKKEIFEEIINRHQNNRLKGYGPLVVAFSNSISYFEQSTALQNPVNYITDDDIYFTMIEQAAKNYLRHESAFEIKNLKLILVVEDGMTKKQRVYFD